jgi:hypothetical protein
MKKLLCIFALLLGSSAHAQVYFDSASARPNNPEAAKDNLNRQGQVPPRAKVRKQVVRCRDGSKRTATMCRGHGGTARR